MPPDETGWREEDGVLVRDLTFPDWAGALAWVNRAGEVAEARGHHPDVLIHGYNNVRLMLSTHSAGGITDADHGLAAALDALS
jgi:4a-hydroxytetrahydrobiopterin dehydratase